MTDPSFLTLTPAHPCYPTERLSPSFLPPSSFILSPSPTLYALGSPALLRLPLTAIFCSRKCPGDAILKAYDLARELRDQSTPVISGFHTPVEQDMLKILLKGKGPLVICPARGLQGMRLAAPVRRAANDGRALLLSIFGEKDRRIDREHSLMRNDLVAALAGKMIFIHVEPGGSLDTLYARVEGKAV